MDAVVSVLGVDVELRLPCLAADIIGRGQGSSQEARVWAGSTTTVPDSRRQSPGLLLIFSLMKSIYCIFLDIQNI